MCRSKQWHCLVVGGGGAVALSVTARGAAARKPGESDEKWVKDLETSDTCGVGNNQDAKHNA
jgi:hypothetical protein